MQAKELESTPQELTSKYERLTGDILLSAGLVAYLGAFPFEERDQQIRDWQAKARELEIPYTDPGWSLRAVLGSAITIQASDLYSRKIKRLSE